LSYIFTVIAAVCLLLSCGASKRAAAGSATAVQMPLTDSVEIKKSQDRAREVMDSIDRVRAAEAAAPAQEKAKEQAPAATPVKTPATLSDQVVAYARTFTGVPYKLGATGPKSFDCSGFTSYVYKHFGYKITAYSGAQFNEGREVKSYADLQKGDLVFFGKRGSVRNIGHVGIVTEIDEEKGSFRFIHASTSGGVKESDFNHPYFMMRYIGARRILPDEGR